MLVDNAIPPIFKFKNADIEVVPVEAICGVFEIKRFVDKSNSKEFINKLTNSILNYDGLTKSAAYNPNVANPTNLSLGITSPLIGIISLTSDLDHNYVLNETSNVIDILWSIDGFAALPYRRKFTGGQIETNLSDNLSRPNTLRLMLSQEKNGKIILMMDVNMNTFIKYI